MKKHYLPEQDGDGVTLLPRPYSNECRAIELEMQQFVAAEVQRISPAAMVYLPQANPVSGLSFFWSWYAIIISIFIAIGSYEIISSFQEGEGVILFFSFLTVFIFLLPLQACYQYLKHRDHSVLVFSKIHQKIIFYNPASGEKKKLHILDYKDAHPTISRFMMVSGGGMSLRFILGLSFIDPETREVKNGYVFQSISTSQGLAEAQWNWIRTYMEGEAEEMPPIFYWPKTQRSEALLYVYADTEGRQRNNITADHTINARTWIGKLWLWFTQSLSFSSHLGLGYIQMTTPNPLDEPEVKALTDWQGHNPYQVYIPSQMRRDTLTGKRRSFIWRWRSIIIGNVIGGGLLLWFLILGLN
ncbi:MAG: DUF6708 domain-containing protein [Pseudomonadota bacterium]|nr:DUF6708 domain-containing protein [Pseudomonadota bacterium]